MAVLPHPAAGPLSASVPAGKAGVVREAVVLDVVVVHDGGEVVDLVVGGGRRGLPGLPLVAVAVAEQAVHVVAATVHAPGEGLAQAEGEAHPQGPRRHLHAGRYPYHVVPLQAAAQLAEGQQFIGGEVAGLGQHSVHRRRGVPLAHDEAVAVRPGGVVGVVPEDAEVEGGEDVSAGEGAARVAGAHLGGHADDVAADAPACRL